MTDLFVRGGRVFSDCGDLIQDILIQGGCITALGTRLEPPAGIEILDATGQWVLPGFIDSQVHFREPGMPHKEDLASGSLAAIAGGVTCFMEMPNTNPSTTDPAALEDKLQRAAGRCWADHGFFLGASPENATQLGDWERLPGCAGVKMFMGSSTGSLLVAADEDVERVLRSGQHRMAVHSEDDFRLQERYANLAAGASVFDHPDVRDVECAVRSTRRLLDLVEKTGRKVHILHVSTADEIDLVRERDLGDLVTCEVTPNHLFLEAPGCYEQHGSHAQMNPPVRDRHHRDALRQGLADGFFACIGSDHAPHTLEEKAKPYPHSPSGIPGVQTTLPLLLTGVGEGWLTMQDVVRVTSSGPARIYEIQGKGALVEGFDGDLTIVDPEIRQALPADWLRYRVGYSPFEGTPLHGWPGTTVVRGRVVYRDHAPLGTPSGRPIRLG